MKNFLKYLNIKANFLSTEFFVGQYESAFKGQGLEFSDIREYISGDDVRLIHWKKSAKGEKLYVKTFQEEREITVIIMFDISKSMEFGTKWKRKCEVGVEVCALFSYVGLKSNDKVGLITFNSKPIKFIPPSKGKSHIWKIIKTAAESKNSGETDLSLALKFLEHRVKRKAVVFIISDFICDNFYNDLKLLKFRYDIVPIIIVDRFEVKFFNKRAKFFMLSDSEKFSPIFLKNEENISKKLEDYFSYRIKSLKKINCQPIILYTDKDYLPSIISYFKTRKRK